MFCAALVRLESSFRGWSSSQGPHKIYGDIKEITWLLWHKFLILHVVRPACSEAGAFEAFHAGLTSERNRSAQRTQQRQFSQILRAG
jgi:hypothetical protein